MKRLGIINKLSIEVFETQNIISINMHKLNELEIKPVDYDIRPSSDLTMVDQFMIQVLMNSINYCFWYGTFTIRPNGMNANGTFELLLNVYRKFKNKNNTISYLKETLINELSLSGITLLSERIVHLNEVFDRWDIIEQYAQININSLDAYDIVDFLVEKIPGYANDLLLKRAMLLPMMLFRETGMEIKNLDNLLVPIDYQIPKVLNHLGILKYNDNLDNQIKNSIQLPRHSFEEVVLRCTAMVATNLICEKFGIPPHMLDDILFKESRKIKEIPHHLTLTTDY